MASGSAISGPNALDVLFSPSYHFSKQYCERPDVLARLERAASEVAGRAISIRFRIDPGEAEARPEPPAPDTRPAVPDSPDEFVGEALSVFGAAVMKVEPLAATSLDR